MRRIKTSVSTSPSEGGCQLAKSDEAGNMKKSIGGQLMQLNPINKEKPRKKFMCRERKAVIKKSEEHAALARFRLREYLIARDFVSRAIKKAKICSFDQL